MSMSVKSTALFGNDDFNENLHFNNSMDAFLFHERNTAKTG